VSSRPEGSGGSGAELGLSRSYRQIAGRQVLFDNEGFLWSAEDWNEDLAIALAAEAGLAVLAEAHWRVLRFLRDYFARNGRAPLNRQLAAGTEMRLLELEGLFPGGIKQGARRLAGLPNPKTCM
jgi:dissimilatory sulfite reductase related protein